MRRVAVTERDKHGRTGKLKSEEEVTEETRWNERGRKNSRKTNENNLMRGNSSTQLRVKSWNQAKDILSNHVTAIKGKLLKLVACGPLTLHVTIWRVHSCSHVGWSLCRLKRYIYQLRLIVSQLSHSIAASAPVDAIKSILISLASTMFSLFADSLLHHSFDLTRQSRQRIQSPSSKRVLIYGKLNYNRSGEISAEKVDWLFSDEIEGERERE